jgi:hypothetical protein
MAFKTGSFRALLMPSALSDKKSLPYEAKHRSATRLMSRLVTLALLSGLALSWPVTQLLQFSTWQMFDWIWNRTAVTVRVTVATARTGVFLGVSLERLSWLPGEQVYRTTRSRDSGRELRRSAGDAEVWIVGSRRAVIPVQEVNAAYPPLREYRAVGFRVGWHGGRYVFRDDSTRAVRANRRVNAFQLAVPSWVLALTSLGSISIFCWRHGRRRSVSDARRASQRVISPRC